MTEQPQRTQLSPEEWKQLCLLNLAQLQTHLQNLPAVLEGGTSAMTAEQVSSIETHLNRGRTFLNAWARAKMVQPVSQEQPAPQEAVQAANGATRVKRKYTHRAKSAQAAA